MLMKEIPCHVCNGHGFICKTSENKAWSEFCLYCHGTGIEEVPVTNADRIRSMTDEDLSEFLSEFKDCGGGCLVGKGIKDCSVICATAGALGIWLQKPAED